MAKITPVKAKPEKEKDDTPAKVKALLRRAASLNPKIRRAQDAPDRITLSGYFHHEQFGEKPTTFPLQFSKMLTSKNQPVVRRLTIPQADTPLEIGWIKPEDVGYVAIENKAGAGMLVNPTEEEKAAFAKQILWIDGWLVDPGCIFIARPEDATTKILRSLSPDGVPINLYVFPK